jgi:hypothetical protein
VAGCLDKADHHGSNALAFKVRSWDVVSATAVAVDPSRLDTRQGTPHFEAELHVVLCDSGVERFQRFSEAHDEQTFELRVNGVVLLQGVRASQSHGGVREMWWFFDSLDETKHFAASLAKK